MKDNLIKNSNSFFVPKTTRAKSLLKKIKQFNKLAEYFNGEEAKNILNNDFAFKQGDKFVESHNGVESKYIALNQIDIEYKESSMFDEEKEKKILGTAYMSASFNNVKVDGSIGKTREEYLRLHPTAESLFYDYDKEIELKKIENEFSPKKKQKHIDIESAYNLILKNKHQKDSVVQFLKYKKLKEICEKYGIEIKIDCIQEFPSKSIYVGKIRMNRESGDILYKENVPLNVPCLLHDNRADKERVGRLKKQGYIENMITTKIRNEMNDWLKENIKNHEFELSFSGNSLLMFNRITMGFWEKRSPGFRVGNSEEIDYYDTPKTLKKQLC
jgi:hypothetical protein